MIVITTQKKIFTMITWLSKAFSILIAKIVKNPLIFRFSLRLNLIRTDSFYEIINHFQLRMIDFNIILFCYPSNSHNNHRSIETKTVELGIHAYGLLKPNGSHQYYLETFIWSTDQYNINIRPKTAGLLLLFKVRLSLFGISFRVKFPRLFFFLPHSGDDTLYSTQLDLGLHSFLKKLSEMWGE